MCVAVFPSNTIDECNRRARASEKKKREAITVTVTGASIQTSSFSAHISTGVNKFGVCVCRCHQNMQISILFHLIFILDFGETNSKHYSVGWMMNPEQATSEMNAALAEFIAVESSTTTPISTPRIHHQEDLDILPLTTEILSSHDTLSRNSRLTIPRPMSTRTLNPSSSSPLTTTVAETTTLPRYKTLLDYSRNNERQNLTNHHHHPTTRLRTYFNPSTTSTNRRKRSLSNEYNSAKRFHSLQSAAGIYFPFLLSSLLIFSLFQHHLLPPPFLLLLLLRRRRRHRLQRIHHRFPIIMMNISLIPVFKRLIPVMMKILQ